MSVTIAGRIVKEGDPLYHSGYKIWGIVNRVQTDRVTLHLKMPTGSIRDEYVEKGGKINGAKLVYWHEPLELDFPMKDVSRLQNIVDSVSEAIVGWDTRIKLAKNEEAPDSNLEIAKRLVVTVLEGMKNGK